MTQKVRLPREVAGAIERLQNEYKNSNLAILSGSMSVSRYNDPDWNVLHNYVFPDNEENFFKLVDALRYGYEIEPEPITVTVTAKQMDHIRLVYSYDADLPSSHTRSYSDGVRFGVRRTLDHLGVEIPGVNAPATSSKKSG